MRATIIKAIIWLLKNAEIKKYGSMDTIDRIEKEQSALICALKEVQK